MKIELKNFTIAEIFSGYKNSDEEGVVGYDGKLNIRPKYQREFVYNSEQQQAVIRTILNGLPLNVMYWCKTGDNSYELMDGQQRTLSFCSFCQGNYNVDGMYFHNMPEDQKELILNYKLFVYVCEGKESEKLEWFKIINIAGEKLTDQELRNAIYSGPWTTDAKRYFSKTGCVASKLSDKYVKAVPIRQELFEIALKWICIKENCTIVDYMGKHQHDANASELWEYFRSVINWAKGTFPKKRPELKAVNWGELYHLYGKKELDPDALEKEVARLMADYDVTKKAGIYDYVLSGKERALSIRTFDERTRRTVYEQQEGICPICKKHFGFEEMAGDHITPWSKGGKTILENCQMLCKECNLKKSDLSSS